MKSFWTLAANGENTRHITELFVHSKMVKMVNFMLRVFYHNQKDKTKTLNSSPTLETFSSRSLDTAVPYSVLKQREAASSAYDFRNCRPAGMRTAQVRGQIVPHSLFGKTAPT